MGGLLGLLVYGLLLGNPGLPNGFPGLDPGLPPGPGLEGGTAGLTGRPPIGDGLVTAVDGASGTAYLRKMSIINNLHQLIVTYY